MSSDPHWPTARDWLGADDPEPDLVVVGVPTSAGSISRSDAWETPAALRRSLNRFSTYDGETGVDLGRLRVRDHGDLRVAHLPADEMVTAVAKAITPFPADATYVWIGGDNLITYPIAANLPHAPIERVGLLTFDAHHDVRALEDGVVSNGSPVRLLLEAGLRGDHVVQIGIHSFANSGYYRRWCEERGVRVATMAMVDRYGIERVVAEALDYLAGAVDAIHVDLDIDVLDRAFAPGCPGARPGGLNPRQLAAAARRCGAHPKVVSADLVEVDATRDLSDQTIMNLATTLLAFASGVASREGQGEQP